MPLLFRVIQIPPGLLFDDLVDFACKNLGMFGQELIEATKAQDIEIVTWVLKLSEITAITVCVQDKDGWTALHHASYLGYKEIVELLLQQIPFIEKVMQHAVILHDDISENYEQDLAALYQQQQLNEQNLQQAINNQETCRIKKQLQTITEKIMCIQNEIGHYFSQLTRYTPLLLAIHNHQIETAKLFLNNQYNISLYDHQTTLLHWAARKGKPHLTRLFLASTIDDSKNQLGYTALGLARAFKHQDCVELILKPLPANKNLVSWKNWINEYVHVFARAFVPVAGITLAAYFIEWWASVFAIENAIKECGNKHFFQLRLFYPDFYLSAIIVASLLVSVVFPISLYAVYPSISVICFEQFYKFLLLMMPMIVKNIFSIVAPLCSKLQQLLTNLIIIEEHHTYFDRLIKAFLSLLFLPLINFLVTLDMSQLENKTIVLAFSYFIRLFERVRINIFLAAANKINRGVESLKYTIHQYGENPLPTKNYITLINGMGNQPLVKAAFIPAAIFFCLNFNQKFAREFNRLKACLFLSSFAPDLDFAPWILLMIFNFCMPLLFSLSYMILISVIVAFTVSVLKKSENNLQEEPSAPQPERMLRVG